MRSPRACGTFWPGTLMADDQAAAAEHVRNLAPVLFGKVDAGLTVCSPLPFHGGKQQKEKKGVMSNITAQTSDAEVFELFGPTIQFITPLSDDDVGYCVLKGAVPPGAVVPIHSHADRGTFYIVTGEPQALKEDHWQTFGAGDVFDVAGGAKHAFRNVSAKVVSVLIVTTMAMARFFRQVGRPIANIPLGPPSSEALRRFAQASFAEGHWLGSAADNAAIGITLLSFK
jgi:quercetin dioxygenase-like cupin family protein